MDGGERRVYLRSQSVARAVVRRDATLRESDAEKMVEGYAGLWLGVLAAVAVVVAEGVRVGGEGIVDAVVKVGGRSRWNCSSYAAQSVNQIIN